MSAFLDKCIPLLLLAIIVSAALAHGAVEPWSVALCSAGLIALPLLWALKAVLNRRLMVHLPSAVWPLAGLLLWGAAQSLTWTNQAGQRSSLSLDVEATRQTVFSLSLLLVAFLVAANFFVSREHLAALVKFLTYYGLALALFALLQHATWDGRFYWVRHISTEEITAPFGPFVHHGHYAGYIEMLLPFPIAMLLLRRVSSDRRFLYGAAATVMGLSVVVSLSRGGMLSMLIQLIFLGTMGYRMAREDAAYLADAAHADERSLTLKRMFSRIGVVVVIVAAIAASVVWMGAEPVLNRVLGQASNDNSTAESFYLNRGWIWRDALTMFRAHPLTGVGLGAFETAFSTYTESDGSLLVAEAHNDYLQALTDGGVIGGVIVLWFVATLLRQMLQGMRSPDPLRAALALGAGTGVVGMLAHSFFDFNLQLPAQALLFVLLVAVTAQCGLPARQRSTV